jgi:transcriptional regulator with XRE-family HTH domain
MDVGSRIKRVRRDRGLTLKDLETKAGVSAAHLSEIERGATSPTLGSLSRIAHALGTSAAFFFEENELGEVSHVRAKDRVREVVGAKGGARRDATAIERLTGGIPGGRLHVRRVELAPGSVYRAEPHIHAGSEAIVVVRGRVRVDAAATQFELGEGDAIHFDASLPHGYANASRDETTVLIWVATRRDVD